MRKYNLGKYNKKKRPDKDIIETSEKLQGVICEATNMDSRFDPAGSYTGRPLDSSDVPTQDVDDL